MSTIIDINEIVKYLPHRYPFLLIDRVVEFEEGKRVVALKNVTMNEPFFPGHFPHHPVMPGVLIVEAMAQAAAVLSFKSMGNMPGDDQVVYFAGIDNVRFQATRDAGRSIADGSGHHQQQAQHLQVQGRGAR